MKIAIFGASVSHQTVNYATGEVTGYAEVLRREHAAELGVTEIRQITYPGNRLSDGGLVRLADVVAWKPDICLFEPLIEDGSRGKISLEAEKRYAYGALLEAGILPVTLLLPDPLRHPARALPHYDQFIGISRQYGLPVIEIDISGAADPESKFNGVHTRLEGARLYARQIVAGLQSLGDPRRLAAEALERASDGGRPEMMVTPLCLAPNAPKRIKKLELSLASHHSVPVTIRVVQPQNIGMFSPIIDLVLMRDGGQICSETLSVWDAFCHYTRFSYVMLANSVLEQPGHYILSLQVSELLPDYAICRRPVEDWPAVRYLEPTNAPVLITSKYVSAKITCYE